MALQIVVLGLQGCLASGYLGLSDLLWLARRTAPAGSAPAALEVLCASPDGRSFADGQGRSLPVDCALHDVDRCDAVLIPGHMPGADGLPLGLAQFSEARGWLLAQHARGALLAAACSGVFVLGEAGLLRQRRCTTTWWLHAALARRYAEAQVVWGAALLEDGGVATSGGPLSWVDLALHVLRRLCGPEAARTVADFAVVDNTPLSQQLCAPRGYLRAREQALVDAELIVRSAPAGLAVKDLARHLALSERTLQRRLRLWLNETPHQFITRIRLETACALLGDSRSSIQRIAQQCGYENEASFRRAFVSFMGLRPGDYRRRAQLQRAAG